MIHKPSFEQNLNGAVAVQSLFFSGESEVHILAKVNAIQDWRQLMGPTKVYQTIFTHPDSIRGQFGLTDTRNAAHGSG